METQQRASVEDIIRQGTQANGENFDEIYSAIEKGIQNGRVRILRHKNTLCVYVILQKGVAEVHLYSIDQPPAMIDAFKDFYHAFQISGFKSLHSTIDNPQLIRLIQMANIPVHAKQTQDGYEITTEVK